MVTTQVLYFKIRFIRSSSFEFPRLSPNITQSMGMLTPSYITAKNKMLIFRLPNFQLVRSKLNLYFPEIGIILLNRLENIASEISNSVKNLCILVRLDLVRAPE